VFSRANRVDNEPRKFSREAGVRLPPAILDSQNIREFPGIYGNSRESREFPRPSPGVGNSPPPNCDVRGCSCY